MQTPNSLTQCPKFCPALNSGFDGLTNPWGHLSWFWLMSKGIRQISAAKLVGKPWVACQTCRGLILTCAVVQSPEFWDVQCWILTLFCRFFWKFKTLKHCTSYSTRCWHCFTSLLLFIYYLYYCWLSLLNLNLVFKVKFKQF